MTEMLFILPSFAGGGAERVVINLLNRIHSRGVNVRLVVFNAHGPLRGLISDEVKIDELCVRSLRGSVILLIKKIREVNPAVIISTLGYINLVLVTMSVVLPKRCRIWIREANLPSLSLKYNRYEWLMRLGYRVIYRYADRIIVTSQRMRQEFISEFNLPPRIIDVLPNPIDEEEILSRPARWQDVSSKTLIYIACGRLTYQKGFDRLLPWFAELNDPGATLMIFGDGEMIDELKDLASFLHIADRVIFTGFTTDHWQWFKSADVFLLPSRWEGMPNVALEALACGLPVIATPESGGIAEVAAVSEPGAVQMVQAGRPFLDAMRHVVPRDRTKVSKSMLPSQYRLESVVDILASWLNDID